MNTILAADDAGGGALGLATIILPLLGIAIPILVAELRGVVHKGATIILSLLLGWTVVGAIVPLIVAVTAKTRKGITMQAKANAAALQGYSPPKM
jgi:hypothetical protein